MHVHIQPCGQVQAGTYGVDTPVTRAARQHLAPRMTKLSLWTRRGRRTEARDQQVCAGGGPAGTVRRNRARLTQSFVQRVRTSRSVAMAADEPGGPGAEPLG